MERRKPKLLIIGHAKHGKDTVAEMIRDNMELKFVSSSVFVAEEIIWPLWGQHRYPTFKEMFDDRVNYRPTWFNLIAAYNTPDQTKTATTIFSRGYDMYVGMRRRAELEACKEAKLFDLVLWVDAKTRHPVEGFDSMELREQDADVIIDNNGSVEDLNPQIHDLRILLHNTGFDVGLAHPNTSVVDTKKADEEAWKFMPEGATPLLDHGFIILRDHMGSDHEIAESARMSYGRGTKKVNADAGLLRYLMLNHHSSPFEMAEIKVHMRLPVFVMRQWIRHRTANVNEYSGRYSEMPRLFYIPTLDQIKIQDSVNKQGSSHALPEHVAKGVQTSMKALSNKAFDDYELMLKIGVSRETARIILPLNIYTEVVWKIDLNNLIKLLVLRDDDHAQWEIRQYAKELAKIFAKLFPETFAVYEEMRQQITLTRQELLAVVTNTPESPQWGLGKGQVAKVSKVLDWLMRSLKKPN